MDTRDYLQIIDDRIENFNSEVTRALCCLEDRFFENNQNEALKLIARIAYLADEVGAVELWREAVLCVLESKAEKPLSPAAVLELREKFDHYMFQMEIAAAA